MIILGYLNIVSVCNFVNVMHQPTIYVTNISFSYRYLVTVLVTYLLCYDFKEGRKKRKDREDFQSYVFIE